MAITLSIKIFNEMQAEARNALIDLIQENILKYMKAKKTKIDSEFRVAKDMKISITVIYEATSLKSFKRKVDSLKQQGEL